MTLNKNVGSYDQWARASLGFVLIFLAGTGVIGAWGYVGVILLATAMVGYCPLYQVLGLKTRHGSHKPPPHPSRG